MGGCSMEHLSNHRCLNLVEAKDFFFFFFLPSISLAKLLVLSHVRTPAFPQHLRGNHGFLFKNKCLPKDSQMARKVTGSHCG